MAVDPLQASVNAMVQAFSTLEWTEGKSRRSAPVRRTLYVMDPPGIQIYSYNCLEHVYKKENCPFPTKARGLFVRNIDESRVSAKARDPTGPSKMDGYKDEENEAQANWQIVIRGYDKFFNGT